MPFVQKDLPQYHYADDDALIGLRGAMYYFQNIHTWHLHSVDKGNDVRNAGDGSFRFTAGLILLI